MRTATSGVIGLSAEPPRPVSTGRPIRAPGRADHAARVRSPSERESPS
ncbi:hypothetical protein Ae168Ps1_0566c [Pseudonocardia sp. Ae168_Ps1]|nr:hypothetical protein Ae168Ps1_0566c [Pseudonocardia sp. Ae168_Ps1]